MKTVINKLGLFPEWSNFSEANKNLAQSEDSLVKSLDPIKSFEGSNQNMYEFPNLQILTNRVQEISNVMDNANQAISCESADLKNLESIYSSFQPKKLDKIRFDNSCKRSIEKSNQIHEMIENKQFNFINEDEQKVEPESRQGKFNKEHDEYQKIFIQNLANIINEFSATKIKTATKLAEIGSLLIDKASPIEIIHSQNNEDFNQEMKELKKVVKTNDKILNNEDKVEVNDDDDDFVIVQSKKGVIELSDGEYYDDYEEDNNNNNNNNNDVKEQPAPKAQDSIPPNDENINYLAKMLFDEDTNNIDNAIKPSENSNDSKNVQANVKTIASDFLIPETDEKTPTNTTNTVQNNNDQQTKQKRRHRRGKKGKH